jgi:hypothetical protein
MLYRRVNNCPVDANDSIKVVKVLYSPFILSSYYTLTLWSKYINTILKVDFNLDTTFKLKPIAGLDDLLLLLVQY